MANNKTLVRLVAVVVLVALGWAFFVIARHSIDRDFRKTELAGVHALSSKIGFQLPA